MPTKVFSGKTYTEYDTYHYKSAAQAEAKRLRKLGYNVRLVKLAGGWAVYKRLGRPKSLHKAAERWP